MVYLSPSTVYTDRLKLFKILNHKILKCTSSPSYAGNGQQATGMCFLMPLDRFL
jgi:hypothetical protein